jgi:hypothetical protein
MLQHHMPWLDCPLDDVQSIFSRMHAATSRTSRDLALVPYAHPDFKHSSLALDDAQLLGSPVSSTVQ